MTTILLIEDETAIRDMVCMALERKNFTIVPVEDAAHAKAYLNQHTPDLILLDWMLPQMSGIDFLQYLKKRDDTKNIPVIMLTARAEEQNKVRGLETGADDYVTKPFSPQELVARIKTILRRGPIMTPNNELTSGKICLNTLQKQAFIENQPLNLSHNEYALLECMMRHQHQVLSREQLLNHVWGSNTDVETRAVDSQIKRLRAALQKFNQQEIIQTVRGSGYRFVGECTHV